MLSETSQAEKDKYHMISLMQSLSGKKSPAIVNMMRTVCATLM